MAHRINLDALAAHIRPRLKPLIDQFVPNAQRGPNGWRLGNLNGEKGGSLWIGETGFHDHASGESGSHLTFFSHILGKNITETAQALAKATDFPIHEHSDKRIEAIVPQFTYGALEANHQAFLASRGFDPAQLADLPIKSASNGDIALLHYTQDRQLAFAKYYHSPNKSWYSRETAHHLLWGGEVVADRFPDATTLYITEGHWDAITGLLAGFPCVSVPNGASNHHWIENSVNWLHSYERIVLCYDNDRPGQDALHVASTKLNRPLYILKMPTGCKDLNDVLKNYGMAEVQRVLAQIAPYDPPEVIRASDLYEIAQQPDQCAFEWETPWPGFNFKFRASESTVLTGYTGHGKSKTIKQIVAYIAAKYGAQCSIASFEDTPAMTTRALIGHLHGHPDARKILEQIQIFDSTHPKFKGQKVTPEQLLSVFHQQYQRHGTQFFLVDNLMTLKIDREDNGAQAEAAEMFRQFMLNNLVHLVLMAHPRKPPGNENVNKLAPPDPYQIRGASEIADMAPNILGTVRNIPKVRKLAEMLQRQESPERINQYESTNPDGILQCSKQRRTGDLPTIWLWNDGHGNFHDAATRTTRWW